MSVKEDVVKERVDIRVAATGLYNQIRRDYPKAIATVGMATGANGKQYLVAYFKDEPMVAPDYFEGYSVVSNRLRT